MKSRFMKMLATVLTVCMLMCCLTGCEELSYREAVQLYNAQQYERANNIFYELGDYKDSKALFNDSHYWIALELMESGDYGEALPRFLKLGSYKDSADRAVECKYQLAIEAFTAEDYATAENYFLDVSDYRQTPEYLRQLELQKLYAYILANGSEGGGCYVMSYPLPDRTVNILADLVVPNQISMIATWEKDMGYIFRDSLTVVLGRESTVAAFEASSNFTMDFADGTIGSQQTGTGTIDFATYSPGQALVLDRYEMIGTDNLGQDLSSQDPADSSMDDAMANNMTAIWDCLTTLQATAGIGEIF